MTVGLWQDSAAFRDQVAAYVNDEKAMLAFEKYRRRRVIFNPVELMVGAAQLPEADSDGVE